MKRSRHIVEQLGPTVAAHLIGEEMRRQYQSQHHPLPLTIALQFWAGDQARAMRLARLLADLEPELRTDVVLAFCRRYDVPGPAKNKALRETDAYCQRKFPTTHVQSQRIATGHPDGSFALWAGTAEELYRRYLDAGWPANVFFAEAEGVPLRYDWIDTLKKAHAANLGECRRITGARMEGCEGYSAHVNGSLAMHLSFWADHPTIHVCRKGTAWDVLHGQSMLRELGNVRAIVNLYGAHGVSLSVFKTYGRDFAWLASVKDESAWTRALMMLGEQRKLAEQAHRELHNGAPAPWEPKAKPRKGKKRCR